MRSRALAEAVGGKRARTRRVLLTATLQVLAEQGVAGASLERIARRAGVSRAAIYAHFPGRDALLLAAAGPAALGLEAALDAAVLEGAPLKTQLRRLAETLLDHFAASAPRASPVAVYQLHAVQAPESRARLAAAYWQVFERLAARLAGDEWEALALAARALTLRLLWQALMSDGEPLRDASIEAFEALAERIATPQISAHPDESRDPGKSFSLRRS